MKKRSPFRLSVRMRGNAALLKTVAHTFTAFVLLMAFAANNSMAADCGGNGQKACSPFKKGPICEPGLGKVNGKLCAPCGSLNQKQCPAAEQGKSCRNGLVRSGGYCRENAKRKCGGNGQKACNPLLKGPICNAGLGKVNGNKCAPCGRAGQVACPAAERGRQCAVWTTSVNKRCKPCGGNEERACRVTDKGRSCKKGLSRKSGRCVSKSSYGEKYNANKSKFEPQHRSLAHDLANVKGAGTSPPASTPSAGGPIDVEGWSFQAATDEDKRALMARRLDRSDVSVVTLVSAGGGAVVGGYTHAWGYAMMKDYSTPEDGSDYTCRKIRVHTFTAGLALGGGTFVELGDWSGDFDTLAGWSNGWQLSMSVLGAGWGKGAHWSRDEGGSDGVTVLAGTGLGLDLAGEYARAHTKVKDEIACGNMEW